MPDAFHTSPILNSPYEVPTRHWVLDDVRQPTDTIGDGRRKVSFISPIPKPRKTGATQAEFTLDAESQAIETSDQQYQLIALIDSLRQELAKWRALPEREWRVTPETAKLLKHWRHHRFTEFRPFFCQVEAVETAIWLTEVAPGLGKGGSRFLNNIEAANQQANPDLSRMALKLATGAGKTAVKALLDPYNPIGTTRDVNFTTSRTMRYEPGDRCHLNWAILDSRWEGELCRVLDSHPKVLAWVKNRNLGFEVPYRHAGETRRYIPDFVVLVDDGLGADDPLHLVAEVKGYRGDDAKAKKDTMDAYWVPSVNALGCHGRWAFLEFRDAHDMGVELDRLARSKGRGHGSHLTKDQALDLLRSQRSILAQRFGVAELALFGSIARDEGLPNSDIDVLVKFEGRATLKAFSGTEAHLQDLFGRRVDLVTHKALRPELRPYVEREAIYV